MIYVLNSRFIYSVCSYFMSSHIIFPDYFQIISYLVFCLLCIPVAFVNLVYDATAADHKGMFFCQDMDHYYWYYAACETVS